MEPVRKKELEKTQTLELEQKLLNIIDESKGKPKTEKLEDFMKQREARAWDQSAELDQKKKVLEKVKKEEQWSEDDAWRDQRLEHRKQIQARGPVQTPQMWEAKQVDRWCQQRLRDLLVPLTVQAESPLPSELSAVLEDTKGLGQRSVLCDYLQFVCLFGCEAVFGKYFSQLCCFSEAIPRLIFCLPLKVSSHLAPRISFIQAGSSQQYRPIAARHAHVSTRVKES
ncbi:cpr6 [Symbiodinium sp. CCMP2456]|nr:cpr6 [Symbiodinium sp. CCMP2456]